MLQISNFIAVFLQIRSKMALFYKLYLDNYKIMTQ